MAMSLTRRATVCAVAVAALVSSVAHAQCDPSSRITLATSNREGVMGFTGAKSVAGAATPAIEKVCAVFVCPAGTDRAELSQLKLARSEAVPVSALSAVQTRVGNTGPWRPLTIPMSQDLLSNSLGFSGSVPLAPSTAEEVQVEVSVQTSTVATVVTLSVDCLPTNVRSGEFPMVPYVIASHIIPLLMFIAIIIGLLLRQYHPAVRAKLTEWGWCSDTETEASYKNIKNRAGGAMWYDHASEVVENFTKEKIYETDDRVENAEEEHPKTEAAPKNDEADQEAV